MICGRYITSALMRQPRIEHWDNAYDRHDPVWIDPAIKRSPKIRFPYLHNVTERQVTIMQDAMDAAPRWLEPRPQTPGFQEHSEAVANWLDSQMRWKGPDYFSNNRDQHKRWGRFGPKYGNGWLHAQWDDDIDGVRFSNVDTYDVYPDARWGNYYIVRRVMRLADLMDWARGVSAPLVEEETDEFGQTLLVPVEPRDGGKAERAVRKIEREIKKGNGALYIYNPVWGGHGNSRRFDRDRVSGDGQRTDEFVNQAEDPFNAMISVLEYWETHRNGIAATIVPSVMPDGESLVLRAENNPYECAPLVPFVPHAVDNEIYGYGNSELIGKISETLDYLLRAQVSMVGAAGWPPLLHTRGANLRQSDLASIYGKRIKVRSLDDLGYMPNNISPGMFQIVQQVVTQVADFALGESEVRRGNVGQARNATAAAIAEQFGNVTDKTLLSQFHDSNEQLGHVCLQLARVHLRTTAMIPPLGRGQGRFLELKPEVLRESNWALTFGGSSRGANSTAQITAHLNIAQAFGPSGELDVREVLRETYRLTGERNPDRFLSRKDPVPVVAPNEEHRRLLQAGERPQISQSENLQEHAIAHQEALQQWPQFMDPNDSRLVALLQHYLLTVQMLQAQSQPQGATQFGSELFQPAQAGAAGQPASQAGGGFDNLGQQRNGSNVAAGGGAPGPSGTVPNRQVGQVVSGGPQR